MANSSRYGHHGRRIYSLWTNDASISASHKWWKGNIPLLFQQLSFSPQEKFEGLQPRLRKSAVILI